LNFNVIPQIGLGTENEEETKHGQAQKGQSAMGDQKKTLTYISQNDFD
jgi:hypothetical protein